MTTRQRGSSMAFCAKVSGLGLRACCGISGALLAVTGAFIATLGHDAAQSYVRAQIQAAFVLTSPAATQYGPWADSSDPNSGSVISSYYCSNITNPEEVLAGGKPNLVEIGPLKYHYRNEKYNITWDENGEVVQYVAYQYYTALDEATLALEQQVITTIDLVLAGGLRTPGLSGLIPFIPQTRVPDALFTRRPIRDLIWGYHDEVLGVPFPGLQNNDTSLDYALSQHSPSRMYTGKTSGDLAYQLQTWDGEELLTCCDKGPGGEANAGSNCGPAWPGFDAANVLGGSGFAFHMGINPSETLQLATYDFGMYRHWPFVCAGGPGTSTGTPAGFNDDGSLTAGVGACASYDLGGLELLHFTMAPWALTNISESEAMGQGQEGRDYGITGPSGLMNQSNCEQHAPIFISRPHFLGGSNSLFDGVTGWGPAFPLPTEDAHGSYFGVEPITGLVMDLHVRVGINTYIEPVTVSALGLGDVTYFPGVNPNGTFLPLCWGGQDAVPTDAQRAAFEGSVYKGVKLLVGVRWGGTALGALGGVMALAALVAPFLSPRCRKGGRGGRGGSAYSNAGLYGRMDDWPQALDSGWDETLLAE